MDGNTSRILLIEDEEAHAELIRRAFESQDGQVDLSVVGTLQEARASIAGSIPDLVIADMRLPDGNGLDILPAEKEELCFPVVVLTAHGDEQVAVEAMKRGALDYVVKSEATLADTPHIARRTLREWGHITERKQAEERSLRQNELLVAINKVLEETLVCETDEEVARKCLAVAEELTDSKLGFIGEVNQAGRLDTIALSGSAWDVCRMPKSNAAVMIKDMEIRGIWGSVLIHQRSQIVNAPESHPERVGAPEGHPSLTSFLGVPLKHGGETFGMIALANKESGFDSADQQAIETLSVAFVEALNRKRAEQARRASEETYKTLVDASPDAVTVTDLQGHIVYASQRTLELHGFERAQELLGKSAFDLIAREDHEKARTGLQKTLEEGVVRNREYTLLRKDGTRFAGVMSAAVIRDAVGKPKAFVGVVRDITQHKHAEHALKKARHELETRVRERTAQLAQANEELRAEIAVRKRVEEELRESEERFRAIADYGYDVEDWVAPDGRLLWINPAVERLTGYSAEECLAMPDYPLPLVHEEDRAVVARIYKEAEGGSSGTGVSFRTCRKDGSVAWMEASWQPICSKEGANLGSRTNIRDVTQRKQAEQRAEQLRGQLAHMGRMKTMGEMASGIAHELNQPLAAILMQAEVAAQKIRLRREQSNQDRLEMLEFIASEAHRAGQIIRRMREFVKRVEPHRTSLDLVEIIGEVVPLVESDLRHARIAYTVDVDQPLPMVLADKIQVQQVLLNLLRNAFEAIERAEPGGHEIGIRATARDGLLEVAVCDTGCGIPDVPTDCLFGNFYSTKPEGMGLGLGISRSVVEAHGGHIWAARNPDRGTTFAFTLPILNEDQRNELQTNRVHCR